MTAAAPRLINEKKFTLFLGASLLIHLLVLLGRGPLDVSSDRTFMKSDEARKPLKIHTLGVKQERPVDSSIYVEPMIAGPGGSQASPSSRKQLKFSDLKVSHEPLPMPKLQPTRPGTLPVSQTALQKQGIRFSNQELKKMALESYGGASQTFGNDKVSLRYEVPDGKSLDELNEAELRLYSFLKRGAKNYATSVAAELHDFSLKYPHLRFPMVEDKHVMTGRMTYDGQGNLKQIKMIRWSNNDKLQEFFEKVLKRMEIMQNPPQELWAENDEFTIFMTLQING